MKTTEYYNAIARGYNQLHAAEQIEKLEAAAGRLVKYMVPTKHAEVLDVGCGTGVSSDFWSVKFGCDVVGIDPSKELIGQNTTDLSEFLVGFAESLPFSDAAFDLVVSFTAVQNFDNVARGLIEMKRVCKLNGWLLITTLTKGPRFSDVRAIVYQKFSVVEEFVARNDTVWICRRDEK